MEGVFQFAHASVTSTEGMFQFAHAVNQDVDVADRQRHLDGGDVPECLCFQPGR